MTHIRSFLLLSFSLCLALCGFAKRRPPYEGTRILWDMGSRRQILDDGWYARMIQLNDGRLMAASESCWNVIATYSDDMGKTWSPQDTLFYPPEGLHYFDVDLCRLSDGKIIVTYNIGFPDESAPDGRFGVRLRISEDNGATWTDDIFVYDGERTFENGTWEPNILELPSGELHLYVSDEAPYTESAEQCIQLFRSFDKGYSWQGPETVSFRKGARDGMPTALVLGDSIVVTIEDNGWPGMESFIPVTVRTPLEDNWRNAPVRGNSQARSQIIDPEFCPPMFGGAPYMRQLPGGETLLSRQSYLQSGEYGLMNMFVYVGDSEGRRFKAMATPFGSNLGSRISTEVNSISVVGDSLVYALGGFMSGGTDNRRHVDIVAGYPVRHVRVPSSSPSVDGRREQGEYAATGGDRIIMGSNALSRNVYADLRHDDRFLYLSVEVEEPDQAAGDGDSVCLLVDADNVSDDTPVKGMYEFILRPSGKVDSRKGDRGRWVEHDAKGVICRSSCGEGRRVYEAAVPWRKLGKRKAPEGQRLAFALEVTDNQDSGSVIETLPDARHDESWTWLEMHLTD